jgi:hypothetical protein
MKMPSVTPQHIKTVVGDHGLNRIGDAIVMGLQFASKIPSGGIRMRVAAHTPGQNAQLHCLTPHK